MAFCRNCGTQLTDDTKFCPNCGTPVSAEQTERAAGQTNTDQQTGAEKSGWEKFCDTPGITDELDQKDVEDNKVMAIFSYIFWLCLIPLLARKESKFCQFHATQGMFLAIIESAVVVLGLIPILGWIVTPVLSAGCTFFAVVGIINVAKNKARELPIIGKYNFLVKK